MTERPNGVLLGATARQDDDEDVAIFCADRFEQLQAVHVGHLDVREHQVRPELPKHVQTRGAIDGHLDGVPLLGNERLQEQTHAGVILDDEHFHDVRPAWRVGAVGSGASRWNRISGARPVIS